MKLHTWAHHVTRGSSPVDWCEDNYKFSPLIAEFFNTISNIVFLVIPPFLMHLHRPYAAAMGPGIHIIWLLLIIVGASSAYFHATLSLLGQLLDEIAILWVIMAGFAMWYPKAAMPPSLRDKEGRKTFITFVLLFTAVSTYLGFLQPSINAFFLMTLGVPATSLLVYNLRSEEEARVTSLGKRSVVFWVAGVLSWISDRMCCDMWLRLGFPYLHGFWHVLIFLAAYTAVVLFAYYDVKINHPLDEAIIRYWPLDTFEFGIPYVQLKHSQLKNKQHL